MVLILILSLFGLVSGFPNGSAGEESACNAGDTGDAVIPWLGSPRGGNGNPLQCSCLKSPMDRERSLAGYSPKGLKKSDITK